jgi:DNA anti-recombination protein RmuC
MRRWLLLPVLAATLICVTAGQNAGPPPGVAARAAQFESNYGLFQVLVENGLRLAGEDDALKRADYCDGLVERFAAELKKASADNNQARVAELGQHLHDLLSEGVAANLRAARQQLPADSDLVKSLHSVRAQAERSLAPVEEQLKQSAGTNSEHAGQRVLKLIRDARSELDKSLELRDLVRGGKEK